MVWTGYQSENFSKHDLTEEFVIIENISSKIRLGIVSSELTVLKKS